MRTPLMRLSLSIVMLGALVFVGWKFATTPPPKETVMSAEWAARWRDLGHGPFENVVRRKMAAQFVDGPGILGWNEDQAVKLLGAPSRRDKNGENVVLRYWLEDTWADCLYLSVYLDESNRVANTRIVEF